MKKQQRKRAVRKTVKSTVKSRVVQFRVTPSQFKSIKQSASSNNMTVSMLIEEALEFYIISLEHVLDPKTMVTIKRMK